MHDASACYNLKETKSYPPQDSCEHLYVGFDWVTFQIIGQRTEKVTGKEDNKHCLLRCPCNLKVMINMADRIRQMQTYKHKRSNISISTYILFLYIALKQYETSLFFNFLINFFG